MLTSHELIVAVSDLLTLVEFVGIAILQSICSLCSDHLV